MANGNCTGKGALIASVFAFVAAVFIPLASSLAQQTPLPREPEGKKSVPFDPFSASGNFLSPAGNFSAGDSWTALGAKSISGAWNPFIGIREDGKLIGGMLRVELGSVADEWLVKFTPVPQAVAYARVNAGGKFSLYPLASYSIDAFGSTKSSEFMLGSGIFYDWKVLGISGYAAYANGKLLEGGSTQEQLSTGLGKGAVAGLGWDVRKGRMSVRHKWDVDFRTGERHLSVDASLLHCGMLYETEKSGKGKKTHLGAHVNFGNGESGNCLSIWAKAGCDGKLDFSRKSVWKPVVGVTMKCRLSRQKNPVGR